MAMGTRKQQERQEDLWIAAAEFGSCGEPWKVSGTVLFVSILLLRADSGFHPCRTKLCVPLEKHHFHHGLLVLNRN